MDSQNVAVMVPPQFAEFMQEFFGDKRGVLSADGNILSQSFALDSVFTMREIDGINGDFLYADSDSTGFMYVKFNGLSSPWLPVRPNFAITGFPIRKAWVRSTTAQAGKQINLYWGYGAKIIPPNQDITSIGSITNTVGANDVGFSYGAAFTSASLLAANTPQNIIAAASNLNGYTLWAAQQVSFAASPNLASFLAKASAPASTADGDGLGIDYQAASTTSTGFSAGGPSRSVRVAAGKRLDRIAGAAETIAIARALYTLA